MNFRPFILLAALAFKLAPASAQAPGGGVFQRFNQNGDGVLTEDELLAEAKRLVALDKNTDGRLAKDKVIDAHARFQRPGAQPAPSDATGEAAEKITSPILSVVAENEELGSNANAERAAAAIRARGVPAECHVITHYGVFQEGFDEATNLEVAWFEKHLKSGPDAPIR